MATSKLMRAIRVSEFGAPSVLKLCTDLPVPNPGEKQVGDRVFTTGTVTGGYAEFTLASEDTVHKLPDYLDYKQGAAIGVPYFTAYRALVQKAHAKAGETVLIHGASGGVGSAKFTLNL
ncbi:hypothetical protein cypCar_00046905 [Cyprinus carpio]|nr:hypothetical protein cypCar_00046905 [Cyprinus carpio]